MPDARRGSRQEDASMETKCSIVSLLAGAVLVSWSGLARAQVAEAPPAHTEAVAAPPAEDDDDEVFTISLGTTFSYGNTRSLQIVGSTHLLLHRDIHLFTVDLQGNFGTAAVRDPMTNQFGDFTENAQNILGRMRYDIFLDPDDALFLAVAGRHDRFAGLDFRFQGQAGYLRNFFREGEEDSHRMWGELGFDVTVDDRSPNPLPNPRADPLTCGTPASTEPCTLPNIEDQYSVRLYVGYDNHMNEAWQFLTGLEALFDVVHGDNVRLSSISELRVTLHEGLQASLRFTFLYDHVPVPGRDAIDTTTVLSLLYTFT
jgi:hypothetical protein